MNTTTWNLAYYEPSKMIKTRVRHRAEQQPQTLELAYFGKVPANRGGGGRPLGGLFRNCV